MRTRSVDAERTTQEPRVEDDIVDGVSSDAVDPPESSGAGRAGRTLRVAALTGSGMIVAVLALVGWLGFDNFRTGQQQAVQAQFVQAARQGALNLTTIDWKNVESDVDRIVNGATGDFHDDFSSRAADFAAVVKQAQSTSVGTVIDAGLESQTADTARALVAVSVQTTTSADTQQPPRTWRMRMTLQQVDDDQIKVANVEFVA